MLTKQAQAGRYTRRKTAAKSIAPEMQLQRQCETYLDILHLQYIRIPDAVYKAIFGSNSIAPHLKRLISASIKGLPDITILYPSGRYVCIELKSATGKQSLGQKQFERSIGSCNYYLINNFDDFKKIVDQYRT